MIDAGLCTESQYHAGEVELIDRMARVYESSETHHEVQLLTPVKTNQWDIADYSHLCVSPAGKKAKEEFELFCAYKSPQCLPDVEPKKVLGAIGDDGQYKEPILSLGPVLKRGKNLPSGKNHADYVDGKGYYNIVQFLEDHEKYFPGLFQVGVGQLSPHITTEVDCECLFSQAGHLSDPTRASTKIRTFERLVIAKHRLQRIYCCPKKVLDLFMERFKSKNFDEGEDRDDLAFLQVEKQVYLDLFPHNKGIFGEEEEDDEAASNKKNTITINCL